MSLQNLMWVCTRHCLFLKTTLLILRSVHHVLFVKAALPSLNLQCKEGVRCPLRTAIGACADIPFALTAVELHCIEKSLQRS